MGSLTDYVTEPYTSYDVRFRYPTTTSQSPVKQRLAREKCCDMIGFLALLHIYSIDIAFVSWEGVRGILGKGGTALVHQSMALPRVHLAFKRLGVRHKTEMNQEYRILMSEILASADYNTRNHPHLACLEGMTWELQPDTGLVMPVLLFQKADCGDLYSFLRSPRAHTLTFEQRLHLCQDVATGLRCLHEYGIIHGDISPRNVLVFDCNGSYYAKLSDFGYAALMAENDTIDLATTWPWCAPETERTWEFSFEAARMADTFSFSMVCLWVLFNPSFNNTNLNREADLPFDTHWIETLKSEGSVLETAIRLAESADTNQMRDKLNLSFFFRATLVSDPKDRSFPARALWEQVDISKTGQIVQTRFHTPAKNPISAEFKIVQLFQSLVGGDFRLWQNVFEGLEHHAKSVDDEISSRNALFQLSICYYLGFGCKRSETTSQNFLSKSGASVEMLLQELSVIRKDEEPRHVGVINQAKRDTRFHSGLAEEYKKDRIIEEAYTVHEQMATTLEKLMGKSHSRVVIQKIVLAEILEIQGKENEAEVLLLEARANERDEKSWSSMRINEALAGHYSKTDQWSKGKMYAKATDRYTDLRFTIRAFEAAQNWNGLVDASEAYLNYVLEESGEGSPASLEAIQNLALAFLKAERRKESKDTYLRAVQAGEKTWGLEDPVVQYYRIRIPGSITTLRERKLICDIGPRVLTIYERAHGVHPLTLSIIIGLADSLLWTGRIHEAFPLQQEALQLYRKVHNGIGAGVAIRMNNLASCYFGNIQWFEAERVQDEAVRLMHLAYKSSEEQVPIALVIQMQFMLYHYRAWIMAWTFLSCVVPESFLMWTAQAIVSILCWSWIQVCSWL